MNDIVILKNAVFIKKIGGGNFETFNKVDKGTKNIPQQQKAETRKLVAR